MTHMDTRPRHGQRGTGRGAARAALLLVKIHASAMRLARWWILLPARMHARTHKYIMSNALSLPSALRKNSSEKTNSTSCSSLLSAAADTHGAQLGSAR